MLYVPKKNKFLFEINNFLSSFKKKIGIFGKKKKKKKLEVLSKSTIIIYDNKFSESLQMAMAHFNIKKKDELVWSKIFFSKPSKEVINDAYKFIALKNQDDFSYFFDLDSNYTTNISSIINIYTNREGKFIKLNLDKDKLKLLNYNNVSSLIKNLDIQVDDEIIGKILGNSKKPVKVSDWTPSPNDGKLKLDINSLKTKLFITITPASKWGKEVDLIDIEEAMSQLGIIIKPSKTQMESILREKKYLEKTLLVESYNEQVIKNDYFEEVFRKKKYRQDWNKYNFNSYIKNYMVDKDELLVINNVKIPKIFNLYKKAIRIQISKEDILVATKNTYIKNNKLYSKIHGSVYRLAKNKWNVEDTLILDKINNKNSPISHNGTIIVKGSIENGPDVYATKDIVVAATVSNTNIKADGNISVKHGIVSNKKNTIEASRGSLSARYLQGATVVVKEKIKVKEIIYACKVICGDEIEIEENKGSIWGGDISVYNKITTFNLGSLGSLKTNITLGYPFNAMLIIYSLENKLKKKVNLVNKLDIERNVKKSNKNKQEYFEAKKDITAIKNEIENIKSEFIASKSNIENICIKINKTFYGNVDINIYDNEIKNIYEKQKVILQFNPKKNKISLTKLY